MHNGEEALLALQEFRPDTVFLDIGLPGMNGYEVARRIRAMAPARMPRLIALTGWGGPEDRRQADEAGFDEHVVKPLDPARLDELLGRPG